MRKFEGMPLPFEGGLADQPEKYMYIIEMIHDRFYEYEQEMIKNEMAKAKAIQRGRK